MDQQDKDKAARQAVLLQVEARARAEGIKQPDRVATMLICRDAIMEALTDAGLMLSGLAGQVMVADFGSQMADKLHRRNG